jgi:cellulose synthase operon protein C
MVRAATVLKSRTATLFRCAEPQDEPKENRPMTVRWKPLLILSGLFVAVALIGVVAITITLVPRSSEGILKRARAAGHASRFADAEIYYKQVLQLDAKNAAVHREMAGMYREWLRSAPAAKRPELRGERQKHLLIAVKFGKADSHARHDLLEDAMNEDLVGESLSLAKDLLKQEPNDPDAHFVLAVDALEGRLPDVPEARRHLKVLEEKNASLVRRLWIRAKLADATADATARGAAFAQAASLTLAADCPPIERITWLRIITLQIRNETLPASLGGEVRSMLSHVKQLADAHGLAPARVARLRTFLELTQRGLIEGSSKAASTAKAAYDSQVEAIELELEAIFKLALSGEQEPDLQTFLSYADHLMFRRQRDRCLEVIDQALRSPQAARRNSTRLVMNLHTIAAEVALSQGEDEKRYDKAQPHVQALLDCTEPMFQGRGHFLAGSIELDQSGAGRRTSTESLPVGAGQKSMPKLRKSALYHLKLAAAQLPEIGVVQARYGVALVLAGEQNLGRQFLQNALRLGNLDSQLELWAAWTVLQAGYPEEAEPIINLLAQQVADGTAPRELSAALHLLRGEILQSRRSPEDLKKAAAEFEESIALGPESSATVLVRLAQIDVQLGEYQKAIARIDSMEQQGKGSPSAEQLAIMTLEEQGKKPEARARLERARARYPKSPELAGLDAALVAKDNKPAEADRILAEFLKESPDQPTLVMMRAQLQADSLKNDQEARTLLSGIADRSESSAPLVQLAGLELERNQLEAAADVIAKIRARWPESATSDVLSAQLELKLGHTPAAVKHFDSALKKDPNNKIVQYWKAQLDGQTGSVAEAARTLEAIVRDKPIKELDPGTSLLSAAQSALANLSLRTGAFDDAIRRFEELKRGDQKGTLTRSDRWQLINAYVARGQWPLAKRELAAILNDAKNPPGDDDRVRGANLYRQQGEDSPALAQLDYVLDKNPTHPWAAVTRSYIFLKAKQADRAAAILRKAVSLTTAKEKPAAVLYLMLAAAENERLPVATGLKRALAAIDEGLARLPDSIELIQAKHVALRADGQADAAVAFVQAKAKEFPKGPYRAELVTIYRDLRRYDKASALLSELNKEAPDDINLAASLIQTISLEAADAGARNETDRERSLDQKAAAMLSDYRTRFADNLVLLQIECDMVARHGDFTRAIELTREMDKTSKTSPAGALLRARLYTLLGRTHEVAQAYTESLKRNPRQLDVRILLGQAKLRLGEPDAALKQAKLVLDVDKKRLDAVLLQAKALAESGSGSADHAKLQQAAIGLLEAAIAANPEFLDAYHTLAEIRLKRKERASAAAVLKDVLKVNPKDAPAASLLIEVLASGATAEKQPSEAELAEARRVATELTKSDPQGSMSLAVAVGFHKAQQLQAALPYAEAAATRLNTPPAHINLGDLLLSIAESQPSSAAAKAAFAKAVEQYDIVLKFQPNSIEAVNNKAWILHSYLDRSREALDIVVALQKRVNAGTLPCEFYDTLGAIQEKNGQSTNAEQSYLDGLKKSPEHAMLNFHFGKMIASDHTRAHKALPHLKKAVEKGERTNPQMAQEAIKLVQRLEGDGRTR